VDFGRFAFGSSPGWEALMAKLLDHAMPLAPDEYDADTFVRIMRDIEMALTKMEFPAVISGEDDTNGVNWFMD